MRFRFERDRSSFSLALALAVVLGASVASAIAVEQSDDFQDGTTQGWTSGSANPQPPSWVPDGGSLGAGDGFLRVEGAGGEGPGSNLVAFNTGQWTGNYLAAGVRAIRADLRNLGPSALEIRLLFEGPGGGFVSIDAVSLAPGGGWRVARFEVGPDALEGPGSFEATLADVGKLRILHVPGGDDAEPVEGVLGVDNVTALSGDACRDAGLSQGALGVCSAYCEALDCDGEAPRASARACARLASLLERRTGDRPPCEIADADADGVADDFDNCPETPNGDQADADDDGFGDACDNCPVDPNPDQEDSFGTEGVGDVCDCPCFTTADVRAIAEDERCDPFCVVDRPTSLGLVALQCSPARPDFSAVVELFTDFGGDPLCQLNLPAPDASVVIQGLSESQADSCRAYVLEAGEASGVECQ